MQANAAQPIAAAAQQVAQQLTILGIRLEGWLTIIAVIVGPILAVQAQKHIERRREERTRKLWLFRELMATRGTRLSPRHVEALNLIELEYDQKKEKQKQVFLAWRAYFDILNNPPADPKSPQSHYDKRDDKFVALLCAMGAFLGFDFDEVAVRRNSYTPTGHGEMENEINVIRKALAKVFTNKQRAIPITMVDAGYEGPPVITAADFGGATIPENPHN